VRAAHVVQAGERLRACAMCVSVCCSLLLLSLWCAAVCCERASVCAMCVALSYGVCDMCGTVL